MAGTVQMNPDQARSWQSEIEALNSRLQTELGGVNESVQSIGQDGQGSIVDKLINSANDMIQSTTELVNSFANLIEAVDNVITKALNLMDTVEEGLLKVGKFFI